MIDFSNKPFIKLKKNPEYAELVTDLLIETEHVIDAYKSMRDGVIFTNKRIIAVTIQGLIGNKKDYTSMPYKNIITYSVKTASTFDLDSELEIHLMSVGKVKFDFRGSTDLVRISKYISEHIL